MTLQSSMRRSRSRGHPAAAFEQQTRTNRTDGPPLRRQTLQRGYPRLTLTHESLSAQSKYGGIAMTSRFLAGAVCATTLLLGTCANADPGVYPMSNFLAMFSAVPRQVVNYPNKYEPGTVIVNTHERRLYLILGKGQAMRYGIGVGREGFTWAGVSTVTDKRNGRIGRRRLKCSVAGPIFRTICTADPPIRSVRAPCIWAIRCTASMDRTSRTPSALRRPRAASGSPTRTSSISTIGSRSARLSSYRGSRRSLPKAAATLVAAACFVYVEAHLGSSRLLRLCTRRLTPAPRLSFRIGASKRHRQPLMRSIAVHEINPLPGNRNAACRANKAMQRSAAEYPLRFPPVFQKLKFGAHRAGAAVGCNVLHGDVADYPAGARARLLRIDARAGKPPHPRFEQSAIVVDQGDGVVRRRLAGLCRHPVPCVRRKQAQPVLEARFIEQPRLVDQKLLALEEAERSRFRGRWSRVGFRHQARACRCNPRPPS